MGRGKPTEERTKRGFRIQWTIVAITLGLITAAGGSGLLVSPFLEVTEHYKNDWLALALLASGLFTANMARMLQIWLRLKNALHISSRRRKPEDNAVIHRGFRELFVYVFASFLTINIVVFSSTVPELWYWPEVTFVSRDQPVGISIVLGCLGLTLLVPFLAFVLSSHEEEQREKRKFLRSDAVATETFWISALVVASIVALARWAAAASSGVSENLAFAITFLVICLFIGCIFVPHVNRYFTRQREAREATGKVAEAGFMPLDAPAVFVSWIDSLLVRLVAPLSGATQRGRGVPHLLVILTLVPLTGLGFLLAAPYGLVPIAIGMLVALALGRRWAWIEEDRETASRLLKTDGEDIHVGFDNDLKDEALLGYASLFVLVPLALNQIHGLNLNAFQAADGNTGNAFYDWMSFFGAELAKAVPFVDWWEIYNVNIPKTFEPVENEPLGKHLTFSARAMVDLVIMAALFQFIAIWQRGRMQRKLYDLGQVNHFDPFAERDFFENAFLPGASEPKPQFDRQVRKHVKARKGLYQSGEPYSPERLADLIKSDNPAIRQSALWMVREFGVLAGTPREKLEQLRDQWLNISFPQLATANTVATRNQLIEEKHKFEQVLRELSVLSNTLTQADAGTLLAMMEAVKSCPEFSFSQIQTLRLFGVMRSEFALLALACHVVRDTDTPGMAALRQRITGKFGRLPNLRFGLAPMRARVYEALEQFGTGLPTTLNIHGRALDLLKLCAEEDGAQEGAARAARAVPLVEAALAARLGGQRSMSEQSAEFDEDEDKDQLEPA